MAINHQQAARLVRRVLRSSSDDPKIVALRNRILGTDGGDAGGTTPAPEPAPAPVEKSAADELETSLADLEKGHEGRPPKYGTGKHKQAVTDKNGHISNRTVGRKEPTKPAAEAAPAAKAAGAPAGASKAPHDAALSALGKVNDGGALVAYATLKQQLRRGDLAAVKHFGATFDKGNAAARKAIAAAVAAITTYLESDEGKAKAAEVASAKKNAAAAFSKPKAQPAAGAEGEEDDDAGAGEGQTPKLDLAAVAQLKAEARQAELNLTPGPPKVKPDGADPAHANSSVLWAQHMAPTGSIGGADFAPWAAAPTDLEGWANVEGQDWELEEPPIPELGKKSLASGVIIREPDGRLWLTKPTGMYGGYRYTLPKGGAEEGLSLQANAIKEAYEETGLQVKIIGFAADVERDTSVGRYYYAERVGGTPAGHGWESEGVALVPPAYAHTFLNRYVDQALAHKYAGAPEPPPPPAPPAGSKPGAGADKHHHGFGGGGQTSLFGWAKPKPADEDDDTPPPVKKSAADELNDDLDTLEKGLGDQLQKKLDKHNAKGGKYGEGKHTAAVQVKTKSGKVITQMRVVGKKAAAHAPQHEHHHYDHDIKPAGAPEELAAPAGGGSEEVKTAAAPVTATPKVVIDKGAPPFAASIDHAGWPAHNTSATSSAKKIAHIEKLANDGDVTSLKMMALPPSGKHHNIYQKGIITAYGEALQHLGIEGVTLPVSSNPSKGKEGAAKPAPQAEPAAAAAPAAEAAPAAKSKAAPKEKKPAGPPTDDEINDFQATLIETAQKKLAGKHDGIAMTLFEAVYKTYDDEGELEGLAGVLESIDSIPGAGKDKDLAKIKAGITTLVQMLKAAGEPEPTPTSQPEPAPKPVREPKPEPKPEPAPAPAPKAAAKPKAKAEPKIKANPDLNNPQEVFNAAFEAACDAGYEDQANAYLEGLPFPGSVDERAFEAASSDVSKLKATLPLNSKKYKVLHALHVAGAKLKTQYAAAAPKPEPAAEAAPAPQVVSQDYTILEPSETLSAWHTAYADLAEINEDQADALNMAIQLADPVAYEKAQQDFDKMIADVSADLGGEDDGSAVAMLHGFKAAAQAAWNELNPPPHAELLAEYVKLKQLWDGAGDDEDAGTQAFAQAVEILAQIPEHEKAAFVANASLLQSSAMAGGLTPIEGNLCRDENGHFAACGIGQQPVAPGPKGSFDHGKQAKLDSWDQKHTSVKWAQKQAAAITALANAGEHQALQDLKLPQPKNSYQKLVAAVHADALAYLSAGAPAAPPAPGKDKPTVSNPQDPQTLPSISSWSKGKLGQLGSNPGAQMIDPAGVTHYVKFAKSDDHAKNEVLAARLYELAGAPVMTYELVDTGGGKLGTATKWAHDKESIHASHPTFLTDAPENFAVHAWLSNWDCVGLEYDNQAVVGGKLTTLDTGGALLYRAQGSPKGKDFADVVTEWDSFRDGKVNSQTATAFGKMTAPQLIAAAQKVAAIADDKIREVVIAHGPGTEQQRKDLAEKLIKRKADILAKAAALQPKAKAPAAPAPAPAAAAPAPAAVTPPPSAVPAMVAAALPTGPKESELSSKTNPLNQSLWSKKLAIDANLDAYSKGHVDAAHAAEAIGKLTFGKQCYHQKVAKYQAAAIASLQAVAGGAELPPPSPAATPPEKAGANLTTKAQADYEDALAELKALKPDLADSLDLQVQAGFGDIIAAFGKSAMVQQTPAGIAGTKVAIAALKWMGKSTDGLHVPELPAPTPPGDLEALASAKQVLLDSGIDTLAGLVGDYLAGNADAEKVALILTKAKNVAKNRGDSQAADAAKAIIAELGDSPGDAAQKLAALKDFVATAPKAKKPAAPKKPPFDPSKISEPPSFLNWGGSGKPGPSSVPMKNQANHEATQALYEAAKTGDPKKVEAVTAKVVTPEGAVTGTTTAISSASSHVKGYAQQVLNEIDSQLNPPVPPKTIHLKGNNPLAALHKALPPVKGHGPGIQALGRFIVLGATKLAEKLTHAALFDKHKITLKNGKVSTLTYRKLAQAAWAKMPQTQQSAIVAYTGGGYTGMNAKLWEGNEAGQAKAAKEALLTLGHDIEPGTMLSRNFSFSLKDGYTPDPVSHAKFLGLAPGTVIQDPAVISTSIDPSTFAGHKISMKITIGPGVKGLYVGPGSKPGGGAISQHAGEDEVILPPNTRYVITKIEYVDTEDADGFGYGYGSKRPLVHVTALPSV